MGPTLVGRGVMLLSLLLLLLSSSLLVVTFFVDVVVFDVVVVGIRRCRGGKQTTCVFVCVPRNSAARVCVCVCVEKYEN